MANFLMKENPIKKTRDRVYMAILLCVTMILLTLQPYSFDLYRNYAMLPALGYGGATYIYMHVFNILIKKQSLKRLSLRTIVYEIGFVFSLLLLTATVNLLLAVFFGKVSLNIDSYLSLIKKALIVGLIPTFLTIMYIKYKSKSDKRKVDTKDEPEQRMMEIKDMAGNTKQTISSKDFIYAEIRCNTLYIYFMHEKDLLERHLRATINSIESTVCDENILRCHRSFIINVKYINKIEGNSNGYKLYLKCSNAVIPVSRHYTLAMKNLLNKYAISI